MDAPAAQAAAPRRRLPRTERERQLIEVAEQVLAELGVGASMDVIAARAGVTKPVLYQHFSSKDALVAACFAHARTELFRLTTEAVATSTSLEEGLWRTLRTFFGFVADHAHVWSTLSAQGALRGTLAADELKAMRQAQAGITEHFVRQALPEIETRRARVLIQAVDGAAEQVARGLRDQRRPDLDQITDDLVEAFWLGLRAMKDGERWTRPWTD